MAQNPPLPQNGCLRIVGQIAFVAETPSITLDPNNPQSFRCAPFLCHHYHSHPFPLICYFPVKHTNTAEVDSGEPKLNRWENWTKRKVILHTRLAIGPAPRPHPTRSRWSTRCLRGCAERRGPRQPRPAEHMGSSLEHARNRKPPPDRDHWV